MSRQKIIPTTWYGEQAKELLSEKNVFGKMNIDLELIPNILHESVLILQEYDNELKKQK